MNLSFQFNLKTMFFWTSLLAVCFAMIGWRHYLGCSLALILLGTVLLVIRKRAPTLKNSPLGILLISIGLFSSAVLWVAGPPIPTKLLNRIHTGMSSKQVLEILGKPESIGKQGQWYYSPWGNPGWMAINFDKTGVVSNINDERAWVW